MSKEKFSAALEMLEETERRIGTDPTLSKEKFSAAFEKLGGTEPTLSKEVKMIGLRP